MQGFHLEEDGGTHRFKRVCLLWRLAFFAELLGSLLVPEQRGLGGLQGGGETVALADDCGTLAVPNPQQHDVVNDGNVCERYRRWRVHLHDLDVAASTAGRHRNRRAASLLGVHVVLGPESVVIKV